MSNELMAVPNWKENEIIIFLQRIPYPDELKFAIKSNLTRVDRKNLINYNRCSILYNNTIHLKNLVLGLYNSFPVTKRFIFYKKFCLGYRAYNEEKRDYEENCQIYILLIKEPLINLLENNKKIWFGNSKRGRDEFINNLKELFEKKSDSNADYDTFLEYETKRLLKVTELYGFEVKKENAK